MRSIRALSRSVYLASPSTITFTFDTISSQEADFGLAVCVHFWSTLRREFFLISGSREISD